MDDVLAVAVVNEIFRMVKPLAKIEHLVLQIGMVAETGIVDLVLAAVVFNYLV